jgi:hypothetical protein
LPSVLFGRFAVRGRSISFPFLGLPLMSLAPALGVTITETAQLRPSDRPSGGGQSFGGSVSLRGDVLLIGAAGDDDVVFNSGAAYVFRRDDAGTPADPSDDAWIEEAKLLTPVFLTERMALGRYAHA